jgi:hypothetical protein
MIDAELCLPGAGGAPDFVGLHLRMRRRRRELMVYAFDRLGERIAAADGASGCGRPRC